MNIVPPFKAERGQAMRVAVVTAAMAAAAVGWTPAAARDSDPCPAGMVCASKPETVVAALQADGYKAKLTKDTLGDPMIESAGGGYKFNVYFYGCEKNRECDSLQFQVSWEGESIHTPALANKWNETRRWGQASVNDKKEFAVSYDLSTVGGVNAKNFANVLEWWEGTLSALSTFWKDNPSDAAPKAATVA